MKKNILAVIFLTLLLSSCYKDIGNYDYDDEELITIDGLKEKYSGVAMVDTIDISPTVSSTDPNAEFEYLWYMFELEKTGKVNCDTIAYTKDLNYLISKSHQEWQLVFEATNTNTGLKKMVTSNLKINTEFTQGWYVLKDDGTNSDLDMFTVRDTIVPVSVAPNVYSRINGKGFDGKAKTISFFSTFGWASFGVVTEQRLLAIASEKDVSLASIKTMEEYKGTENMFLGNTPSVMDMGFIGLSGYMYNYIINDGKLHYIYGFMPGDGSFSLPLARNLAYDEYHLSDYVLLGVNYNFFFDDISSKFVTHNDIATELAEIGLTSTEANVISNKKMLYMGLLQDNPDIYPVAVVEDKTDSNIKYIFRVKNNNDGTLEALDVEAIHSSSKLFNATKMTVSHDNLILYFVVGNELWSRNLLSGLEQHQYTAPAGEDITMIRHRKYTNSDNDPQFSYNYIIVATSDGSNYTVNFFSKRAGNLKETPDFSMSGTGSVKDIIFVSQQLEEGHYEQGY
ncbi:MAG: PKD-like family lipoprotein [Bacteroidales bacterium]